MKKILALILCCLSLGAVAQSGQQVLITMPPGSGIDVQARVIVKRYEETYGKNSVVFNRVGAEGVIGITHMLENMPNDTLMFPSTGHVIGLDDTTYKKVAPLIETVRQPFIFVARQNFPASNWSEFVEYARANPGKVSIAIGAKAMALPVVLEVERRNNIKFNIVFYGNNTNQAIIDMVNNSLDMFMSVPGQYLSGGVQEKVKVLAITTTRPIPGIDSKFLLGSDPRVGSWYVHQGIYVNANIDPATKKRLHQEFSAILNSAWANDNILSQRGIELVGGSVEDFEKANNSARQRWMKVEKKD